MDTVADSIDYVKTDKENDLIRLVSRSSLCTYIFFKHIFAIYIFQYSIVTACGHELMYQLLTIN